MTTSLAVFEQVQGKYAMQLAPNNGKSESNAPLLSDRQDEPGADSFYLCCCGCFFSCLHNCKKINLAKDRQLAERAKTAELEMLQPLPLVKGKSHNNLGQTSKLHSV